MRKLVTIVAGFLLMGSAVNAQQVTGTVKDDQGKVLDKATVSLLNAKDSSVAKLGVTGSNGKFSIGTSKPGELLNKYITYRICYKIFKNI